MYKIVYIPSNFSNSYEFKKFANDTITYNRYERVKTICIIS
jgi:hypothetical protein